MSMTNIWRRSLVLGVILLLAAGAASAQLQSGNLYGTVTDTDGTALPGATVTVDGVTHELELPFLVLATQNPIESEGTYNLPEAQLDRFMLKLSADYPSEKEEAEILIKQSIPDYNQQLWEAGIGALRID